MGKNLNKTFSVVILFVVVIVIILVFETRNDGTSLDQNMTKVAGEINRGCPVMIDSVTRFDNTAALTNNVFQFNFTILNADKHDYDTMALQELVKKTALNSLKTDPKYRIFRDNSTKLRFTYHDKNAVYLCNVILDSDEYNR